MSSAGLSMVPAQRRGIWDVCVTHVSVYVVVSGELSYTKCGVFSLGI